ncbi:hypothetical protein [Cellulosilyticum sp. I15G10I2]|uniref:hypothetical protein n=1 Tax=Cellulosilyticum sp. I15G10I2 TaxID=1892843 RepID=UPI00085C6970|nr:hypothetical protein [Cellulosilyticum sp. I15G10I2]
MFDFFKKSRKIILQNDLTSEIVISNNEVDIKKTYIKEILNKKKLPIVLLDPLWHSIRDQIVSESINKNEGVLQELLKEQGKLTNDYKEYGIVKQNFFKQILTLSGELQGEGDTGKIEKLNKLHESTLGANQKIEAIEKRLEEVEEEIEKINRNIIEEIIALGYEYISLCKNNCQHLEKEINELREKVVLKTNEKKKNEQILKGIYNYMHHVVGQNQIEVIDKELWDKEK